MAGSEAGPSGKTFVVLDQTEMGRVWAAGRVQAGIWVEAMAERHPQHEIRIGS